MVKGLQFQDTGLEFEGFVFGCYVLPRPPSLRQRTHLPIVKAANSS
jgi:hypothetical protein